MYLRTTSRRNKDGSTAEYVQLAHNFRDPKSRKPKAEILFNFGRREVRSNGRVVPALPKEIDLARFLIDNRGRVITRDELLLKVWEYPVSGLQTRTVDNYVMKLRQKVEPDPARPRYILTVRGKGYRLADA